MPIGVFTVAYYVNYCKSEGKTDNRKEVRKVEIKDISTKELVEELKKREGVETTIVEPYAEFDVKGNGPAIVLTVID